MAGMAHTTGIVCQCSLRAILRWGDKNGSVEACNTLGSEECNTLDWLKGTDRLSPRLIIALIDVFGWGPFNWTGFGPFDEARS